MAPALPYFVRDLSIGDTGDDVRALPLFGVGPAVGGLDGHAVGHLARLVDVRLDGGMVGRVGVNAAHLSAAGVLVTLAL